MSTTRTEAIILRRTNYGEADRVVQFLTPQGKMSALARGVRKEKSKLAGGIELLATTDITLHSGRGDLAIVTSARLNNFFAHILEDYDRLQFAYYALKDIGKTAEYIEDAELFTILRTTLESLDVLTVPLGVVELWYRLQVAELLGVAANLTHDSAGVRLSADARYRFDVGDMAFGEHAAGEFTSDHIKLLRLAQTNPPLIIAQVSGLDTLLAPCLMVARAAHE